jgi:outer membrane biosynthesis protein TonB
MAGTPDQSRRSLWTALAVSLAIHAGAGVVAARDFDAASFVPRASPLLAVRIANAAAPRKAVPSPSTEPAPVERAAAPAVLTRAPDTLAAAQNRAPGVDVSSRMPTGEASAPDARTNAQHFAGHVSVAADPTLQRVGWFLETRSRTEFPVEVKEPVRMGEELRFDYPAAALEEHREGAVLAWLTVGPDGAVTELDIVSGDDDFSVAVANALATARFLPATDLYDKPISFYAVLEFDFHVDRVGATDHGSTVTVNAPAQ